MSSDFFVDYTNATELEKFTNKLAILIQEIIEDQTTWTSNPFFDLN